MIDFLRAIGALGWLACACFWLVMALGKESKFNNKTLEFRGRITSVLLAGLCCAVALAILTK